MIEDPEPLCCHRCSHPLTLLGVAAHVSLWRCFTCSDVYWGVQIGGWA